jgi:hypothetical protein
MFIGVVCMLKDFVETVNIDAQNADEASRILAEYVYTNYNSEVPKDGYYYNGVLIDASIAKTIGKSKVAV